MNFISLDGFSFQPDLFLIFGIFLICGVLGVIVGSRIKGMPTITSFMLLGIIIGPHGLGLISKPILANSYMFIDVALGLILYKLGNMLHPKAMFRSKKLMLISFAEISCTFLFIFEAVILLRYPPALAALIGAIAVSSSPAVLVHVSEELHAKGPVTDQAKSLVALNNLFSFMIFSMALPFAITNEHHAIKDVFILPVYQLAGSALLGITIAWVAARINRMLKTEDLHYRFALVVGAIMVSLGLTSILHTSSLLTPLILGIGVRWFENSKHNLSKIGLGEGGDLFFIVLFVIAGAKIDPSGITSSGYAVAVLVIVRCMGKFMGTYVTMPHMGFEQTQYIATAFHLTPMAGMAIGLVTSTSETTKEMGVQLATIVFAMVAIFETIGPFAVTQAFLMSKEAQRDKVDME